MAVYMILEADVHDPEAYEIYKQAAPQYVARHGGEYCVRGGESTVFGGDWQPGRVVILKFPSRAAYDAFMDDPDYRPWREKREAMTTIKKWVVIDGV